MKRARLAAAARRDLHAIEAHIRRDNPRAALRLVDQNQAACRKLGEVPGMGRLRDELSPGLRSFPVSPYLIFYYERGMGVEVARIVHGARDLGELFS
jgi:toxin ParE1/3/4